MRGPGTAHLDLAMDFDLNSFLYIRICLEWQLKQQVYNIFLYTSSHTINLLSKINYLGHLHSWENDPRHHNIHRLQHWKIYL